MKKRIPTVVAALVFLCFLIGLSPGLLRTAGLFWGNHDSMIGRHGFYFRKRQWLADIRTIAAAFRFLYTSHPGSQSSPISNADDPQLPPHGKEISTNLLGMDETESPMLLAGKRLSKSERIMARYRWSSFEQLPPMLAFAEISSNGLSGLQFHRFEIVPPFPEPGTSWSFRLPPPARATPAKLRSSPPELTSTNLQGA